MTNSNHIFDLCKEKRSIQPRRGTIKHYVVLFLPKDPSTQHDQRVKTLPNVLVESAASLSTNQRTQRHLVEVQHLVN